MREQERSAAKGGWAQQRAEETAVDAEVAARVYVARKARGDEAACR
ncbi:hypothetical protein [Sorangium cellulosum]|nr:hypothetical protein [Sorangium cellulosum]